MKIGNVKEEILEGENIVNDFSQTVQNLNIWVAMSGDVFVGDKEIYQRKESLQCDRCRYPEPVQACGCNSCPKCKRPGRVCVVLPTSKSDTDNLLNRAGWYACAEIGYAIIDSKVNFQPIKKEPTERLYDCSEDYFIGENI